MIIPMSVLSMPAASMACSQAGTARSEVPTPSAAKRRSLIPVRFWIHSSLVSIP